MLKMTQNDVGNDKPFLQSTIDKIKNHSEMNNNVGYQQNENIKNLGAIKEFYKDSVVLITGGTGFLGKVIIEKLLRSCSEMRKIFLLIRTKRGVSSLDRFKEFIEHPIFNLLRSTNQNLLDKIAFVAGDISCEDIGLSQFDQKVLIDNVNIVFHVAATVRFDEKLENAINLNTLGTKRLLDLCCKMTKLKSMVHVSTAYCNPDKYEVEETVYNASHINIEDFITCLNTLPGDLLSDIEHRLMGKHPNTYTYTKSLAEQLVSSFSKTLPICIVRPSIITASISEPYKGWIDNIYGITGIMLEISRGTISSIICNRDCLIDVIPADLTANMIIAAAWYNQNKRQSNLKVYNCTSGSMNPINWQEYGKLTVKYSIKNPSKYVMLYPGFSYRTSYIIHKIIVTILHYLPAYLFDIIMRMKGMKPIMLKVARKTQDVAKAGTFFALHEWKFDVSNVKELIRAIESTDDGKEFNCDVSTLNWDSYLEEYMIGIRKFILKDDLNTMASARAKLQKIYWTKRLIQFACISVTLLYLRW